MTIVMIYTDYTDQQILTISGHKHYLQVTRNFEHLVQWTFLVIMSQLTLL
jgi:hypothetical protein